MDNPTSTENNQFEPSDRSEARQQRREARRSQSGARGSSTLIAGTILVVLGAVLLLENMGGFNMPIRNWWSLFILIPAIGAFERALRIYRENNNLWTAAARSALLGGLVLLLIVGIFLFDLNWTLFGPLLIILAGIGILVNAVLPGKA